MRKHLKWLVYVLVVLACNVARAGAYEDFFKAVDQNDGAAVSALLRRGMDPNTRDEGGQVALYRALRAGAFNAAEALWAHPSLAIDAVNGAGETPLMMAALRGQVAWAQRLLDRGAKLQREGWAPLHYAAAGPSPELVKLLLDRGAPIDARSPNGTTPLMMAARYGAEPSVDLLLQRGADPTLRNQRELDAAGFARLEGRDKLAARLATHRR